MSEAPRVAFAGDREIAVKVLGLLLDTGTRPLALMIPDRSRASHADDLIGRCGHLDEDHLLVGREFRGDRGIETLASLGLDFVVAIHFPYVVPAEVLEIPRLGWVNLHPAFLPWNRGFHTATWAMLDETPAGATLHFMDEGIDTGDVVAQRSIEIDPSDTAHSLYERLLDLEFEVFREAWPSLARGVYRTTRQDPEAGTYHLKRELEESGVQRIDLDAVVGVGDLLRKLRALTTSRIDEAAYYEVNGVRYRVRVEVTPEPVVDDDVARGSGDAPIP